MLQGGCPALMAGLSSEKDKHWPGQEARKGKVGSLLVEEATREKQRPDGAQDAGGVRGETKESQAREAWRDGNTHFAQLPWASL